MPGWFAALTLILLALFTAAAVRFYVGESWIPNPLSFRSPKLSHSMLCQYWPASDSHSCRYA